MGLRLTWTRTLDEFQRLREPWNDLVAHGESGEVWLTHEWFRCWIRHFGDAAAVAVLTAWRDGQVVAAAPMQIVRSTRRGIPVRTLTFLASTIAPPCNFLMREPGDAWAFFDGVLALGGWDVLETRDLEDGRLATARWLDYLAARRPTAYRHTPGRMIPFITTAGGWQAYWDSLSKSFRTHLRRGLGRLQKAGSFAVSRVDEHGPFARVFDEVVATSARSWKRLEGTDLKARPALQAFLLEFGAALDPAPFEAWLLRIDGRLAAFDYYLRSGRTLALMRTDFDGAFGYFSPGNGLRYHILADLFARDGVWGYDMGGQARGFKLDWTSQSRPHHTVTVSRGVYGTVMLVLKHSRLRAGLAALTGGNGSARRQVPVHGEA